jgi:hypothetical protein
MLSLSTVTIMPSRASLSLLLVAAAAASGCGSSSSATPSAPSGPAITAGINGIPAYQPSRTITRARDALFLVSPSLFKTVSSYYASVFAGNGWVIASKTAAPTHTVFTVSRGSLAASVVITPERGGTAVAISSYSP